MKLSVLFCFTVLTMFPTISQKNEIEGLFSTWKKTNHPGGVVLVSHKNQVILSGAYGLANIPYHISNTEEGVFNVGSLSKQFTAMGIVLLQLEGKLSVNDDIRTYLPEMNNFSETITIRDLLHHTSGLRSSPELFGLAGWRSGDGISNEDVYRYLLKQTDLNFEPGSEFMYSNSGYILLAKIIENVSKQEFKSWMKEKIFQPLGMNSTFIEEDFSKINAITAVSYSEIGPSFFQTIENNDLTYGASNVYSTSDDMLSWAKNYHKAPKDWQNAFELLVTLDPLNSGGKNNYAFGVVADDFFGNRRIQHTGAVAGFQSLMYCFPDENLQIIILSNFTSNQLSKMANQISRLFLQNRSKQSAESAVAPIKIDVKALEKYEGLYWNDKSNYSRKIHLENDTLWYMRSNGTRSHLIPIGEAEFQMGGVTEKLRLKFESNSGKMNLFSADNSCDVFEKYEDKALTDEALKEYTGTYYSPELETYYEIRLKNGQLIGYHSRFGEFEIQILKQDIVDWSGMSVSKYKRNENGIIIGFAITMNGIRDLWFEKK